MRTVSSRLVQALDDETTADADELGGLAPAGKSPAARAVHVVALAPPATQRGVCRDPAADSLKESRRGAEHVQARRLEAARAPQARPEAGARASAMVHP